VRLFARIAIVSALLVGCQKKSSAPAPSAGSASGSAVQQVTDDVAAGSAQAAGSAGSAEGSAMAGSDTGSAGSNAGSAAPGDAGMAHAGSGVSPELRQEKLNRLKEKRVHGNTSTSEDR